MEKGGRRGGQSNVNEKQKGPWANACEWPVVTGEGKEVDLRANRKKHGSPDTLVLACNLCQTSNLQNCNFINVWCFKPHVIFCYSSNWRAIQTCCLVILSFLLPPHRSLQHDGVSCLSSPHCPLTSSQNPPLLPAFYFMSVFILNFQTFSLVSPSRND